jgi:A/G-specific adenine glycosylase
MDLGADVCAKQNPRCAICPLSKLCAANKKQIQNEIPLAKPRRESEIWVWSPHIIKKKDKILLEKNVTLPFLKNQWLFPGPGKKVKQRPKKYGFKHVIMHYEIFVTPLTPSLARKTGRGNRWIKINELPRLSPFSILSKSL